MRCGKTGAAYLSEWSIEKDCAQRLSASAKAAAVRRFKGRSALGRDDIGNIEAHSPPNKSALGARQGERNPIGGAVAGASHAVR